MKKVKIFLIIMFFIFVAGCKQEYTLVISDSTINEEFKITVDNNEENLKKVNLNYYPLHADNSILYDKKLIKKNNLITAIYKYTYKPYDFVNANTINQCFTKKKVIMDDEKYYEINLSDMTDCMYDYNLKINIITKNKVVSNNADKVKGNKYTWYLTNENKNDFSIKIKIAKGTASKSFILSKYSIYIILGAGIVIVLLAVYMVMKKIKVSNEI